LTMSLHPQNGWYQEAPRMEALGIWSPALQRLSKIRAPMWRRLSRAAAPASPDLCKTTAPWNMAQNAVGNAIHIVAAVVLTWFLLGCACGSGDPAAHEKFQYAFLPFRDSLSRPVPAGESMAEPQVCV
jgi:hypothetical protein